MYLVQIRCEACSNIVTGPVKERADREAERLGWVMLEKAGVTTHFCENHAPKPLFAHVNTLNAYGVQRVLGGPVSVDWIVDNGDCGNVWGEGHGCSTPHTLIRNPSQFDLDLLARAGVPHVIDYDEEWGAMIQVVGDWTENPFCPDPLYVPGDDHLLLSQHIERRDRDA